MLRQTVLLLLLSFSLLLTGCWPLGPLGGVRKSKHSHPEPPFDYTHVDSTLGLRFHVHDYRPLIPSNWLDCHGRKLKSHNNLDIIVHDGRLFVAYRNSKTHFAHKQTYLYIASSPDGINWQCEHRIFMDSDMREPRFYVFNNQLHLIFFQAGTKMLKFEPKKMFVCRRDSDANWGDNHHVEGLDGWVPWRVREHKGRLLLSSYRGTNLYKHARSEIRFYTTTDGLNWTPISEQPQLEADAGSETAFEFDDTGRMWATVRLEGRGAYLVTAPPDDIATWDTLKLPDKYDSAIMFKHRDELFLIARRHPGKRKFDHYKRQWKNLVAYSISVKRTAIYHIDRTNKRVRWLFDLPGRGDTAFAGIAQWAADEDTYQIMNYTNDPTGRDVWWVKGQVSPSMIYHLQLTIEGVE